MGSKEVLIETTDGARYGVTTADLARKLYPGCRILRFMDGTPYTAPKPPAAPRKRSAVGSKRKARAATVPASPETDQVTAGASEMPVPENNDGPDEG